MPYPKPRKPEPPGEIPEWMTKLLAALSALAELAREWIKRLKKKERTP